MFKVNKINSSKKRKIFPFQCKLISHSYLLGDGSVNKKTNLFIIMVFIFVIVACICAFKNEHYYTKTVARIISVNNTEERNNIEPIIEQKIKAIILNGAYKGNEVTIHNKTSYSQVYDLRYKKNDKVFIKLDIDNNNNIVLANIIEYKRDHYLIFAFCIFFVFLILVGGLEGFRALISVLINVIIFIIIVKRFLNGVCFNFSISFASLIFIVLTLTLVSGINRKTLAAIVSTIASTLITMLITCIVIYLTNARGIHFEEMEFIIHSPEEIFFVGLFIGVLGGIMDIAITISSSIKEICDDTPNIELKALIKSGKEIGKDIMGTMTNTLAFAYFCGSMPIIMLWLKNGLALSYILKIGINLEIIRALVGSIGIVLSIPTSIFVSIFMIGKVRSINNSEEDEKEM